MEAMADDEDLAQRMLDKPGDGKPEQAPRRRLSDWSPTVEMLTCIQDRLTELIQVCAMLGGAKPRKVIPAPKPVTAIDRVRKRRRITAHEALVARVLPHKRTNP